MGLSTILQEEEEGGGNPVRGAAGPGISGADGEAATEDGRGMKKTDPEREKGENPSRGGARRGARDLSLSHLIICSSTL